MCFDGPNTAPAANQAAGIRRREDARQHKIQAGQDRIDKSFSQFDPAYYDKFKGTYGEFYNPQIDDQYAKAQDKATAQLANRGTLSSTVGAAKFGELAKTKADAEIEIGNRSVDASNALKKQIEDTKTNLYNVNVATADPRSTATRAAAEAGSIAAPQALSPLGQVFASVLAPLGVYNKADANSMSPRLPWNSYSAPLSGGSSSLTG